ncbi:hypothetical protein HY212_07705 [Candidatus Pacearchaeota archaeon]|nr:hypothetical protein [Candidatus Pacearchaeota archaeon]
MDFSNYTNPRKAELIYREYEPDIARLGREKMAEVIVGTTTDPRTLDIYLDRLISVRTSSQTKGSNNTYK